MVSRGGSNRASSVSRSASGPARSAPPIDQRSRPRRADPTRPRRRPGSATAIRSSLSPACHCAQLTLWVADQAGAVGPADRPQPLVAQAEPLQRGQLLGVRHRGCWGSRCPARRARPARRAGRAASGGTGACSSRNGGADHRGVDVDVRVALDQVEVLGVLRARRRGRSPRSAADAQPARRRTGPGPVYAPGQRPAAAVHDHRRAGLGEHAPTRRPAAGRAGRSRRPARAP